MAKYSHVKVVNKIPNLTIGLQSVVRFHNIQHCPDSCSANNRIICGITFFCPYNLIYRSKHTHKMSDYLCSSRRIHLQQVCVLLKPLCEQEPPWKRSRKPYISIATISIVCWLFEHHASPELSLLSVWKVALLWGSLYCFSCLENAEWFTCGKCLHCTTHLWGG